MLGYTEVLWDMKHGMCEMGSDEGPVLLIGALFVMLWIIYLVLMYGGWAVVLL